MNRTSRSKSIAINGILISLMIIFTFTLLIPGLPISIAFLPLATLAIGSIIQGKWTALVLGFTFGLLSFVTSFISPTPLAPIFQNPLVSLLPRVFIGVLGLGVYKIVEIIINKINKKAKKPINEKVGKIISSAFGAMFIVIFNTLFVLLMIWALYQGQNINGTVISFNFILSLITINFAIEVIITTILTPPIVYAVDKFVKKNEMTVVTDSDVELLDNENNEMINE